MKDNVVKSITRNAFVATIYFVLTILGQSFSFQAIQIRFAEALVLLCFFRRDYVFGVTIGCFISNLFSPIFPWDLIIGTAATFLSCVGVSYCKHLFLSSLIPVVINGFAVALEIAFLFSNGEFWIVLGLVSLGEFIAVSIVGYVLILIFRKNDYFFKGIGAERNDNFKW